MTPTLAHALAWAGDGAAHLRGPMARMGDEAFPAPSALPGWSRAHVLTHIARGAEAMVNLLTWARTGVTTPAYASVEERNADIDAGAARAPAEIRADVIASSDRLAEAVRATPEKAWSVVVLDPKGRELSASEIPWLRARETWIHSVDLDVGASFDDLPRPMLRELISDVAESFDARDGAPPLTLVAEDLGGEWTVGGSAPSGPAAPVEVRGSGAALVAWLLGRSRGRELRAADGRPLPARPRWH